MKLRLIIAIGAAPLLLGAASNDHDVIKRFLAAALAGTGYRQEDFVDTPTDQEVAYLAMLKGCKSSVADTVNGRTAKGWVIEWRCAEKPRDATATVYLVDGKIDRILPTERVR